MSPEERIFVFSSAAAQDLKGIATYLLDAAGPELAREWVNRIQQKCRLIAAAPGELGRPRESLATSLRSFAASPYVLFYRVTGEEVQFVRILHERQDIASQFKEV